MNAGTENHQTGNFAPPSESDDRRRNGRGTLNSAAALPADRRDTLVVLATDPKVERLIAELAHQAHWRVIECDQPREIAAKMRIEGKGRISAVLAALPSSSKSACEFMDLKARHPDVPLIISARSLPSRDAVRILRAGVDAILGEPLTAERVAEALLALGTDGLLDDFDIEDCAEQPANCSGYTAMIGIDSGFRAEIAKAARAARRNEHVVIEGASGTGKKMLARAVHLTSPRAQMPLQVLDLREMAHSDIDVCLFGGECAVSSAASKQRPSIFQACDGGTLVLDGIARLSPSQQQKLAQTITAGRVHPNGAGYSLQTDVRIIGLSRRPLRKATKAGALAADLLASFGAHLALPSLRERPDDIELLARHFLAKFAREADLHNFGVSRDSAKLLRAFQWPGNVRQLQAVLFRAATFSQGRVLTSGRLPAPVHCRARSS